MTAGRADAILVLNAGSSSLKFALYGASGRPSRKSLLAAGKIDAIGHQGHFTAASGHGKKLVDEVLAPEGSAPATHQLALKRLLGWIGRRYEHHHLVAAGHRVVHGGPHFAAPCLIDATVIEALEALIPLAPLHQPHHIAAIRAVAAIHPELPQVAVFDTAFHTTQPAVATSFALPRALQEEGVRRYGFHGISYAYIADALPHYLGPGAAEGRIIVAHLGAGASLCALKGRKSVATTMGFTALDGLVMGKRSGAIDPGVLLYLMDAKGMDSAALSDLLYNQSGLLGVSGISDDMRALLDSDRPEAKEAVDLFVYRAAREIGSLAAALGGLDALVFTAGIGENAAPVREAICRACGWLGLELDAASNAAGGPSIAAPGSRVSAWVIPTGEDERIGREVWHLLSHRPSHA